MKAAKGKGGLFTNAPKASAQAGPISKTFPVKGAMKTAGKDSPKVAVKAKQKTKPMSTTKKLGNHV